MAKVTHEREKCIGCGACVSTCPEFWEMDDDGRSRLKKGRDNGEGVFELILKDDKIECNKEAEDGCPVNCIHVEE